MGINLQGMFVDDEPPLLGHGRLTVFNLGVEKLFDMAAIQAYEMVVMGSAVEFENCLATFEMVAHQQPGLFELGEHAVNRGETDVDAIVLQAFVDIFRPKVARGAAFKQRQHFESRKGGFETDVLEILGYAHTTSHMKISYHYTNPVGEMT